MSQTIRYGMDYVIIGFDGTENEGHWVYRDEITDREMEEVKHDVERLISAGQALDEIFAAEIFHQYVTQMIGVPCVTVEAIFEHLHRVDDGVYTLGELSVSLLDPIHQVEN